MPLPFLVAAGAALVGGAASAGAAAVAAAAGATAAEVAGAAVAGAVAKEVLGDKKKHEPKTSTKREQISASQVPADIRRQIEGQSTLNFNNMSAQELYQAGNEFYYGWNGRSVDRIMAHSLYRESASRGHSRAQDQLRKLF